jgi:hypothetical protein
MALQARLDALSDKPAAQWGRLVAAIAAETEKGGRDLTRLSDDMKGLVASPKSYFGGVPLGNVAAGTTPSGDTKEPAPRRLEELVPVCEFTFEPADGKPLQLGIDGAPLRPLPLRARLNSGRHQLTVRRDKATEERRELLLCGRIATVPVEPTK